MTTTAPKTVVRALTYEEYLTEGEIRQRYDIVEGVRIVMPGPTWRHQRVQLNATDVLRAYEKRTGTGYVIPAPLDILIRRVPLLQTRQPDVLFITRERLAQAGGVPPSGPLEVAPELVVEVISDSETERRVNDKLADYLAIGVSECWLLRDADRTAAVVRFAAEGPETVSVYGESEELQSITFDDLKVQVAELFHS